ncbi:FKBP-type peptidyl-prolyl cis-trans isomerase [Bacteroides propionicifaciens]|jgi:FKBP-type peptidyl-prolyl cis-trans isomerase FklB|uniref:FKBP-type peptidyl-prolyl cis-trans isomerase n=1 Tax=Bacteroides propionicifaciens TaxID=392838 RepID=UPI0003775EC9|nr:FKBP-type peptidyl-prolyl cis-trans isomerase [Bacteroides propionicifaciens]
MDKFSYALGLGIGQNLLGMGASGISIEDFSQAIKDIFEKNDLAISHQEAQTIVQARFAEMQEKIAADTQAAEKVFFDENKNKEGVITLDSGLQYEIITEGNGQKPSATDQVQCHYEGQLLDGTVFDSSIKRGQPASFGVNQVIPGWVEALQLMPEGSKWRLYIPAALGYGANGAGDVIPPYSTLIFDVELLEIIK